MNKTETITLITRDSCPYCEQAKRLLTDNDFSYIEKKIDVDIDRETVVQSYPSQKILPVVVSEDGRLIGGYTELLDEMFPLPQIKEDE